MSEIKTILRNPRVKSLLAAVVPSSSGGSWGSITGTLSSQTDLQTALDAKQDSLVSGTNIKTINGSSILGSGDFTVGGVSGLTANRVPYAASATSLTDSANLSWDNTNSKLTIEYGSIYSPTASKSFFWGVSVGNRTASGNLYNICIGDSLATGFTNVAVGNILIGHSCGTAITGAHYNIAIGEQCLQSATTAGENVAIGFRALQQVTGEDNIGIGYYPGTSLTGTGRNNIFIGYHASTPTLAGIVGQNDYTSGNGSLFIGCYTSTDSATESGQINIQNVFFSRNNSGTNPPSYPETGDVGLFITTPTARLHLPASSTSKASLRLPHGSAPSSPNDGDMWTTTSGLFVRIKGVTVGPLS